MVGLCEGGNKPPFSLKASEMSPGSSTESYPAFAHIGLRETEKHQPGNLPSLFWRNEKIQTLGLNPGSSTESYPAFAHIGLRESPGKTPQPDHPKEDQDEDGHCKTSSVNEDGGSHWSSRARHSGRLEKHKKTSEQRLKPVRQKQANNTKVCRM
ncbi:hypothetical protein ANN_20769 [Periplaneta americana]|uniref:Uncharacterized protein n=1 Tax=Periplaneta americana TaxID=6978 RepID=A0ABQ8SDU0_PERAM|nr:hypothetical protein ANN_20769 [Periplaneta americana]